MLHIYIYDISRLKFNDLISFEASSSFRIRFPLHAERFDIIPAAMWHTFPNIVRIRNDKETAYVIFLLNSAVVYSIRRRSLFGEDGM